MNKKGVLKYILLGILIVFVILLIAGIAIFFYLTSSPTTTAYLLKEGNVMVDQGKGWVNAESGMELDIGDKIKTAGAGKAALILYESAIINLEPNTEILIEDLDKENLKIKQTTGETWNKFTGLLDVKGLTMETPEIKASVQGTSFGLTMDSVTVGEGTVEVTHGTQKIIVKAEEKVELKEEGLVKTKISGGEIRTVIDNLKINVQNLRSIRLREANKKKVLIEKYKKEYNVTDEMIEEKLEEADRGEFDLDEIEAKVREKVPVEIKTISKIKDLTEQIILENKKIERLMQKT